MRGDDDRLSREDDLALVEHLRQGESAALGVLFDRHHHYLEAIARRRTPPWIDPNDVVADAFLSMLRATRNGHGPRTTVRGYLVRTVRRLSAELAPTDTTDAARWRPDDGIEPELAVEDRLLMRVALARLPPEARELLWHTEVEGQPTSEAAEAMGLTTTWAPVLAYRAREALRISYLALHCPPAPPEGKHLDPYELAGYLRARPTARVASHLEACEACRQRHDQLAVVNGRLRPPTLR
jgi:RNA polymerase sigma factor (sigma-70 family)